MAELSKEEMVSKMCAFATEKAKIISHEEFTRFEEENPTELVGPEIRELMIQRATSELILHLNDFHLTAVAMDSENFDQELEKWYLEQEDGHLRKICQTAGHEYVKKHAKPGDENLTFTEKFLRKVRENQKSGNVSSLLQDLDLK